MKTKASKIAYGKSRAARTPLTSPITSEILSSPAEKALNPENPGTSFERDLDRTTPDAFMLYMREIGQTKLLTPAEEITLARRIKKGDKEAREQMIRANLRLVVKIARDYESAGLPLLDLISEGNIGLMTAVERFDPTKGAKLSTYAAFWIKQSIRRALANQSKTIRLPVHVVDKLAQIRRVETKLRTEIGHDPSDEELSEEMLISPKRIAAYRRASVLPASLDAMTTEDGDQSFSEIVPDEKAATPYRQLQEKTEAEMIRDLVTLLDPRERAILNARFGLEGSEEATLDDIGRNFGVTRERIRQIQELALAKLRRKIKQLDSIQQIAA